MEQAIPQRKPSSNKKYLWIIGIVVLLGWVAVMVVNMNSVESTAMQGRAAPDFTMPLFDQLN